MSSMLNINSSITKLIPRLFLSDRQITIMIEIFDQIFVNELLNIDHLDSDSKGIFVSKQIKAVCIEKLKDKRKEYKYLARDKEKNSDTLEVMREHKRLINMTLRYLNKKIKYYNNALLVNEKKRNVEKINLLEKEKDYSSEKGILVKTLFTKLDDSSKISTEEYLDTYKSFIENADLVKYQIKVLDYGKVLLTKILETNNREQIVLYTYSVLDTICNTMRSSTNVDDKKILNSIKKTWKSVLDIYKEKKENKRDDHFYDIMQYFLSSSEKYLYIKHALNVNPLFVNCYKNNEHILVDIVRKYVENYKVELRSQTSYYINKDYFKAIYELYRRNYNLELRDSENEKIDNILEEFRIFVNSSNYKAERKEKAYTSIAEMRLNGIRKKENRGVRNITESSIITPNINDGERLHFDKAYCENAKKEINKLKHEINTRYGVPASNPMIEKSLSINPGEIERIMTNSDLVMFEGQPVLFNTHISEKGNYVLNIHVTDLSSYIKEDSYADLELYDMQKNTLGLSLDLQERFSFKNGQMAPTITYQLEIHPSGKIVSLNFKEGIVLVDKIYDKKSIYYKDKKLSELIRIYRILTKDKAEYLTGDEISKVFINALNKSILSYTEAHDIPFLLWGKNNTSELDYINDQKELCEVLYYLEDKDFKMIHKLIYQNNDELHYYDRVFINGLYENSFVNPTHYVDLYNQRIVQYLSKGFSFENANSRFREITSEKASELNKYIEYLGPEHFNVKCKK